MEKQQDLKQAMQAYEEKRRKRDKELASLIPNFNLSDFQEMLHGQDYTPETIQEITSAIESYQSSLDAKRTALHTLTSKLEECKELAQIVYGKDMKIEIVFKED